MGKKAGKRHEGLNSPPFMAAKMQGEFYEEVVYVCYFYVFGFVACHRLFVGAGNHYVSDELF
jgi:hypothetical protein